MAIKPTSSSKIIDTNRKPYNKPIIERVHLVLGEAVLGVGCKTTSSTTIGFKQELAQPCWVDITDMCREQGS